MINDPDPYNVVIINDRAYPAGGASKVALDSAKGLAGRGHNVTVLAAMGPPSDDLVNAGVHTEVLAQDDLATGDRPTMALQGLWNLKARRTLAGILDQSPRGRTIVHVHSWSKALSPSVFTAATRAGHPLIMTLHDYGFVCPNGALHIYPTGKPCTIKPMSPSCLGTHCDARHIHHKLWRVARQISLRQVAAAGQRVDTAICVSQFSHDVLRPLLPEQLRTIVVDNPITAVDEGPADPAASTKFVYVGRFSAEKGVLALAQATAEMNLPVAFVGEGPLGGQIRSINPQAELTGWLPAIQVRARMRAARAIIMPSTWRETQGMVVPEAFSVGVPVIAGSGTAPAAAIDHGVTGLVFENGSLGSLKAALLAIRIDDSKVRNMGQAAYENFWRAPPTLNQHLDRLESLYREVLGRANGASCSTYGAN